MMPISLIQSLVSHSCVSKHVNIAAISPVQTEVWSNPPAKRFLSTTLLMTFRSSFGNCPYRTAIKKNERAQTS